MRPFTFQRDTRQTATSAPRSSATSLPWQNRSHDEDDDQRRLDAMEQDQPKRRLLRDAEALRKLRRITQAQMAEEVGVPLRTLEEWLQHRRYPRTPGETLIKRWIAAYHPEPGSPVQIDHWQDIRTSVNGKLAESLPK